MPAPAQATYTAAALAGAHTAFRDLIDAGIEEGMLQVFDELDNELVRFRFTTISGTVEAGTGQLTLTLSPSTEPCIRSGTATWARIADSAVNVLLSLPVQVGAAAASGFVVLNTVDLVLGEDVEAQTITIG
jgi:hypothetical protein